MKTESSAVDINRNIGDFFYPEAHVRDAGAGLSERTIHYISDVKEDPDWVREFRLRGLKTFLEKPLPTHWASKDLEAIDFDKIRYYLSPGTEAKRSWDEVPDDIKRTFERLGIPEQERKFLAGVEAQFDSEAVYSKQQIQRAEFCRVQRRFVYLCPARCESETPAAGVFPHQRRKLRAIRAHSHYCGRRLGSDLHGGLHGSEV